MWKRKGGWGGGGGGGDGELGFCIHLDLPRVTLIVEVISVCSETSSLRIQIDKAGSVQLLE